MMCGLNLRPIVVAASAFALLVIRALAATIVVNDSSDLLHSPGCATTGAGTCTLRDAITFANSNVGLDVIHFALAASGAVTITVTAGSQLPPITEVVVIDGTTEPGFSSAPLVELTSPPTPQLGLSGLVFEAGSSGSTVQGMIVNGFTDSGIRITNSGAMSIRGNYVGTDPSGTTARPNLNGITVHQSLGSNRIGGTGFGAGNLISGNATHGIVIAFSSLDVVQGNRIGTDVTGTLPLGNSIRGLEVVESSVTRIGGDGPGEGNLISANGNGIEIHANTNQVLVAGNLIGTAADGLTALGNRNDGILLYNFTLDTRIGGPRPELANVISGNLGSGVHIQFGGQVAPIQGNRIGTDAAGLVAIPNGDFGVWNEGPPTFDLPGTVANIIDNVISANVGGGIRVSGVSSGTILSNWIGTNATGVSPLGNQGPGITLGLGGDATIGQSGTGNVIAFNAGPGIAVGQSLSDAGVNARIEFNSIFQNSGLGIDLASDGVTPNDPGDADPGPNRLLNVPVLTAVLKSPVSGNLVVVGTEDTETAFSEISFQFFLADPDPSGFGEGKTLIYDFPLRPGGSRSFRTPSFAPEAPTNVGDLITATATVSFTSEFSRNVPVTANQIPVANAGPNQTVAPSALVSLDGSASFDPDGLPTGSSILSGFFFWTQTGGPPVILTNSFSASPTFVATQAGIYTFSLVVSDSLDVSANVAVVTVSAGSVAVDVPTAGPIAIVVLAVAVAAIGWLALSRPS
jgi:Right handed beta helix region